jgi:3-hydroxymyristoyl/3-hydroxydecanoyl-(acyl carrier protein) dehydratase
MTYETLLFISPQHPSLAGHFPTHPIVPAVVILEEVIDIVQQWQSNYWVSGIPTVKFLRPWPPGQSVELRFELRFDNFSKVVKSGVELRFDNLSKVVKSGTDQQQVKFWCIWQGENLVKGELTLTPQEDKYEPLLVSGT